MTSGSIRTSSLNTSPVGEHSGKRTSDLTVVQAYLWCNTSETTGRKEAPLDWTARNRSSIVNVWIVATLTTTPLGV